MNGMLLDELGKFQRVNQCETLEELASVIESFANSEGEIKGRSRSFDARSMADYCRNYDFKFHNVLTREYGIRQQAMYILFYKDK